jgi:predicted nucleic acid-binding protein
VFLLDTNVLSELRKVKSGKANENVARWDGSVDKALLHISVISILELEIGVIQVERKDKAQGAALRVWLETRVLPGFAGRILAIDTTIARRCAQLHVPRPHSERDAMIAATALVHGMAVVTRNVVDFKATGVPLVNPWATINTENER